MSKSRKLMLAIFSFVTALCVGFGIGFIKTDNAYAAGTSAVENGTVVTKNVMPNGGFEDAMSEDWWLKWQPWDTDNMTVAVANDESKAASGHGYLQVTPGNGGTRLARYHKIAAFEDGVYRLTMKVAFEDVENVGAIAFIVRELSTYSSKDFMYYTDTATAAANGEYRKIGFSFKVVTNADGSHSIYSVSGQPEAKVDLPSGCEGFGTAMYVQNTSAYRIDDICLTRVADGLASENIYNILEKGSFESEEEIPAGINQWGWDTWYYSDNSTGSEISLSDELSYDGTHSMKITNVYSNKSSVWGIGLQYIMNSDKFEAAEYEFSAKIASDKTMTSPAIGIQFLRDDQTIFTGINDGTISGYIGTTAGEFTHIGVSFKVEKTGGKTVVKIGDYTEEFNAGQQIRFQIYFGGGDNDENDKRTDYLDNVMLVNKTAQEVIPEPDYDLFNNIVNSSFEAESLIANGSFEEGNSLTFGGWGNWVNWFCDYNGTNSEFSVTDEKAHSGEKALKVTGVYSNKNDVWGVGINYAINGDNFTDGNYKFSFWKASDKSASSVIGVSFKIYDKADAEKVNWDLGYSDISGAFTKTEIAFGVTHNESGVVITCGEKTLETETFGQLRIQLYFGGGANGEDNKRTDYLDDVTLVKEGANPVGSDFAFNGWFCDYNGTGSEFVISDEKVHSGSHALKITNVYSNKNDVWGIGMIYSVYAPDMIYDGEYEFSFYNASDKSAANVIGVTFIVYDGSYAEHSIDLGYSGTGEEWTKRSVPFTAVTNENGRTLTVGGQTLTLDTITQLRFKLYFGGGDNGENNKRTDYLDDVSLVKKAEFIDWEETDGENLIENSSFETVEAISSDFSWSNWRQGNAGYASISEDTFLNGTKSLKISAAGGVNGSIYYSEQPTKLGFGKYKLSFYVALKDVTKLEAIVPFILLNGLDSNKVELGTTTSVSAVNGMFVKLEYEFEIKIEYVENSYDYTVTFTSGDNSTTYENQYDHFGLGIYMRGKTDFYFDCFRLEKTETSETAYPQGNLVLNGDFESEEAKYFSDKNSFASGKWTLNSVSETAAAEFTAGRNEGGKAVKVTGRDAEWNALKYTVPALWIEPEKTYATEAYVKPSAPAYFLLIADMNDHSVIIGKKAMAANEWTKINGWLKFSFNAGGYVVIMTADKTLATPFKAIGDVKLYVQTYDYPAGTIVEGADKNCDITIDDFSMKPVSGGATVEIPETWVKTESDFTSKKTNTLWTSYYGKWETADGVFEQTNDDFNAFDSWNRASYFRYGYDSFYMEYSMKVNKTVSTGWAGINFGKAKAETELANGHGYQFVARADRVAFVYEWIYDEEKAEYTYHDLLTVNLASDTTDYVKFAVMVNNKQMTIWVDGIEIGSIELTNYTDGYMTLITGGCTASFKDVAVYGVATKDVTENQSKPYSPNTREDSAEQCVSHVDEDNDGKCDVCGKTMTVNTPAGGCSGSVGTKSFALPLLMLAVYGILRIGRREQR